MHRYAKTNSLLLELSAVWYPNKIDQTETKALAGTL